MRLYRCMGCGWRGWRHIQIHWRRVGAAAKRCLLVAAVIALLAYAVVMITTTVFL